MKFKNIIFLFMITILLWNLFFVKILYSWRSVLYPKNWYPGYSISSNRFLHDFSYAGYHKGEISIPYIRGPNFVDVTAPPYNADNTGVDDATYAIQSAINYVGKNGGGVVYLPAGIYRVKPSRRKDYAVALKIQYNNVILRGAGTNKTYIFNDEEYMRKGNIIRVYPKSGSWNFWTGKEINPIDIIYDVTKPTNVLILSSVSGLNIGDWIVVRADCTADFIADHHMTGYWNAKLKGPTFYRKIVDINTVAKSITIDIPTRYYLLRRDNARVYKVYPHLSEIGIENLSIGMRQNSKTGWGDKDYNVPGTGAYEVHGSIAIDFRHVVNGWVKKVNTFKPSINTGDYHLLSNGVRLFQCRNITISSCSFQKPQYRGGGGNGYMYIMRGNDCLIEYCKGMYGRHNYDFKSMWTSGNVIYKSLAKGGRYASDFHMHLSMANLWDNVTVDSDFLEGIYRPCGTILHGHSTTQSVFWNTKGVEYAPGKPYIVKSQQFGWGYIIGTRGSANKVYVYGGDNTEPIDFVEGVGKGDSLKPKSLYKDQLKRRINHLKLSK